MGPRPDEDSANGSEPEIVGELGDDDQHIAYDEEQQAKCREMVEALTDTEKEHAARSSYRYLMATDTNNDEDRDKYAMKMAFRYLVVCFGNRTKALDKLRKTIQFRLDMDMDGLRKCCYHTGTDHDEETTEKYALYREKLDEEMATGKMFVSGYDTRGCAIYPYIASKFTTFDPEWYLKIHSYTLERAIACTERSTNGAHNKITLLRDHFPELIHHVYLMDAPYSFRVFYSMLYPFIDSFTQKLVKFISGDEAKRKDVSSELYPLEELMPYMHPDGKSSKALDVKSYLYDIPFDYAFDEN
eukprot:scaffold100301_cov55-Attheya_sp.AAC.2